MLAYAAAAGPELPEASDARPKLTIEEKASSGVLYFEESGGFKPPVGKPLPGSIRQPPPPLPASGSTAPSPPTIAPVAPRAPIAPIPSADKTRMAKPTRPPATLTAPVVPTKTALPALPAPSTSSPPVTVADREADLRSEYEMQLESLFAESTPAAVRALRVDETAGARVAMYRDTHAAVRLGWLWLEGKDPAKATVWFQRARAWRAGDEEATRGLAFAMLARRDFAAALALAGELPPASPAQVELRREAWIGIGQTEYGSSHHARALDAFERAAAVGEMPRYARLLRAWSRLNISDKAKANSEFILLYKELQDRESAEGVIASLSSASQPVDHTLASSEPLATLLRARLGEAAFRAGRYLEARAFDPSRWRGLGSTNTAAALATLGKREKTGTTGLGKLVAELLPGAAVSTPIGERASVSLSLDRMRLDAGIRDAGATLGSAPIGVALAGSGLPVGTVVTEAALSLRLERDFVIIANVGSGVKSAHGGADARAVGSIEISATPAWGQVGARVFVEPVRESILSWVGMTDPHGGLTWGGVRRSGAEARSLYLGAAPYSFGFHGRIERLDGTQVAGNHRRAIDVSAGRDLGLPGFAYSSLSIAAGTDAYDRNLSQYTIGHGGYFSPQSYRKAGVAFDMMTSEGARWLVRGRASASRTWKREEATAFFPLAPDGRIYAGSRSNGHEASGRLSAVVQVSPHVQLGAVFGRGISPQWSGKVTLLEMRVLFEPRRGVVSADLPVARGE